MPSFRSLTLPTSLWAKLVGFAGASLTLILVGAICLSILETKARIQQTVDAQATATAEAVANAVAGKLNEAGTTVKTMAGIIGTLHDLAPHDRAAAIAVLKTNSVRYDEVFGAWIQEAPHGGFDGASLKNAPGSNGLGIFTPYWTKTGTDVHLDTFKAFYDQDYYRLPATTGRPAITEPYVYNGNVLMVSIGDPVISNGRLIGVTGVDIGLDRLARSLAALKPFGQGCVMLVSASGAWLVNPDPHLMLKPYNGEGKAELTAALADGHPRLLHHIAGGTAERIIYPFAVPDLAATWAIIIDVPAAVIDAPVRHETDIMIAAGAIIILITLAGLYVTAQLIIQRPMAALLAAVERLRSGDYGSTITARARRDETAILARALDGFRLRLADGQKNEADAKEERRRTDLAREAAQTEAAARARQQAKVVTALGDGLARLSRGDLMVRVGEAFAAEFETLRVDFNAAMSQLQSTVTAVVENAGAVHASVGELGQAADDLASRTARQAASLQKTAAALGEITAAVEKTAHATAEARNVVGEAKGDAEISGAVLRQTNAAMAGIEASSKQIGTIITVIDEIAFQTNLLALNAGVEAARAGDAGRGFAVVAMEVRALSQRSTAAAKEIKTLIRASAEDVKNGVKLVGDTGDALHRIAAQTARLNELITDISGAAKGQATALGQVNAAVGQMDHATQQNAGIVDQVTNVSHALTNEAEQLSSLISQFQITQPATMTTRQKQLIGIA